PQTLWDIFFFFCSGLNSLFTTFKPTHLFRLD
ncbi:MAG: hypothetical protein ACI87X_001030, partial [Candidatus Arcticimaribacter sp.]